MGVKVYYYMVAAVLGFGLLLPQHGRQKKVYITLMAILHTFVCGWRYMYLTGDLRKYAWGYYTIPEFGWFSEEVFNGGRNFGFFWLQKLFSTWTDGDFQIFLIFIAIVTELAVAIIIYRYSPAPWLSYLLWNCFAFYVFGFSAIKQALAMGLLMCSSYMLNALNQPEFQQGMMMTEAGLQLSEPTPNPSYVGGMKRELFQFLSDTLPSGQSISVCSYELNRPVLSLASSVIIAVLSSAVGMIFFKRKDLR